MTAPKSPPVTSLCRYTNDRVFIREADLCRDIIGKVTFTELVYYHLIGRRASADETAMLDAILVTLMEHGFTPSAIATRMIALSSPEAMQAAVAAGLLGVGSQFIGTVEGSAKLLRDLIEGVGDVGARAETIVREYRRERRLLPGFGHHLHRPDDPRTPAVLAVARDRGQAGQHVEALELLGRAVDRVYGRHITINVTGAIGAVLSDMGVPLEVIRGIAVISRAAGLVGHAREERQQPAARFIWEMTEATLDHQAGRDCE